MALPRETLAESVLRRKAQAARPLQDNPELRSKAASLTHSHSHGEAKMTQSARLRWTGIMVLGGTTHRLEIHHQTIYHTIQATLHDTLGGRILSVLLHRGSLNPDPP